MYKIYTKKICGQFSRNSPKLLKVMKLTMILCLAAFMQVSASTFAQKVSLNVKNVALNDVLNKLSIQSGYNFLYNEVALQNASPVTITVTDESLNSVLELCFKDQPLVYTING